MRIFMAASAIILASATTSGLGDDKPPPFTFATRIEGDRLEAKVEKDRTIIAVHSRFGIGRSAVTRNGDRWPETLVLRVHLGSLESLRISNAEVMLSASVIPYQGQYYRRLHLDRGGQEGPNLDATSPYWMEIVTTGPDGKPTQSMPVPNGYFEMRVPKALLAANPKTLTLEWADWYKR
jgi:hypothetical protein